MRRSKGFTLVEIMIVVAIIALLAAIAIPNLLSARKTANEAATQATLKSFATACEAYAASPGDGQYPGSATYLLGSGQFGIDLNGQTKGGYKYDIDYAAGAYTATANSSGAAVGDYDYRVKAGAVLERKTESGGSWNPF